MVRRNRKNLVEKLALGLIVLALGWLGLNAVLAQLQKADAEVLTTPDTVALDLEAGEERIVYVRGGSLTGAGLGVVTDDIQCRMVPADLAEDGGRTDEPDKSATDEGATDEGESMLGERRDDTRMLDGWNEWTAIVAYTAPEAGTYELACVDSFGGLLSGNLSETFASASAGSLGSLSGGVELRVAAPGRSVPSWVSPYTALVWAFSVIAAAGVVYVVAGAFARRD